MSNNQITDSRYTYYKFDPDLLDIIRAYAGTEGISLPALRGFADSPHKRRTLEAALAILVSSGAITQVGTLQDPRYV